MAALKKLSWQRNQQDRNDEEENKDELLVFGYGCKLFRDDEKALYIDEGKHLIPWMGDSSMMIDRYDVRGYLHDLEQHEPKPGENTLNGMSQEELEIEKLCDEERFLALTKDLAEEQMYDEEELKRLRIALASDGAYNEVSFAYNNDDSSSSSSSESSDESEEDEVFEAAESLQVPSGMEMPKNLRQNAIIEKTAVFIAQQGIQMEIMIKTKQSANPQFNFLAFDHVLNPYYRHMVQMIKNGKYTPQPVELPSKTEEEEDDDDGHYLHPSLRPAPPPEPVQDTQTLSATSYTFFRNLTSTEDNTYSRLVNNLKDKVVLVPPYRPAPVAVPQPVPQFSHTDSRSSFDCSEDSSRDSPSLEDSSTMVPPPPDLKPIIDKMAEYVTKNGEDFEYIVRKKNDKRFNFLNTENAYYPYYTFRKKLLAGRQTKETTSKQPVETKPSQSKTKPAVVSFSIKSKEPEGLPLEKRSALVLEESSGSDEEGSSERTHSGEDDRTKTEISGKEEAKKKKEVNPNILAEERLKDKIVATARGKMTSISKEKQLQLERKQKASLFLNMLRQKKEQERQKEQQEPSAASNKTDPQLDLPQTPSIPSTDSNIAASVDQEGASSTEQTDMDLLKIEALKLFLLTTVGQMATSQQPEVEKHKKHHKHHHHKSRDKKKRTHSHSPHKSKRRKEKSSPKSYSPSTLSAESIVSRSHKRHSSKSPSRRHKSSRRSRSPNYSHESIRSSKHKSRKS